MSEHTKPFVRGTLPGWFSTILLAVLCYFGQRTMSDFDALRRDESNTRERVQALEYARQNMELSQKDILLELRTINATLRNRP